MVLISIGQWQNGLKHGTGAMHYPSGNVYHGSWFDNRKEGQGTFKWLKLKEEYRGQFKVILRSCLFGLADR